MRSICKKNIITLLLTCCFLFTSFNTTNVSASENTIQPYAYDVYSKKYTRDFTMSKTMTSISPKQAEKGLPAAYKTPTFTLRMSGSIEYDRITNKYISASSPSVSIKSNSDIVLNLYPVSTWYKDNGKSITFYVSGTLVGKVNISPTAIPCTINYGTISKQFTVNK